MTVSLQMILGLISLAFGVNATNAASLAPSILKVEVAGPAHIPVIPIGLSLYLEAQDFKNCRRVSDGKDARLELHRKRLKSGLLNKSPLVFEIAETSNDRVILEDSLLANVGPRIPHLYQLEWNPNSRTLRKTVTLPSLEIPMMTQGAQGTKIQIFREERFAKNTFDFEQLPTAVKQNGLKDPLETETVFRNLFARDVSPVGTELSGFILTRMVQVNNSSSAQATNRIPLLKGGTYRIEVISNFADGTEVASSAEITVEPGEFISASDLRWQWNSL